MKEKNNKSIVKFHKFKCDLYPFNLVVVITNNETAINEQFKEENGEEISDLPESCEALTMNVRERKTNAQTSLIVFRKREYMTTEIMCHESFHAMQDIAEKIGLTFHNNDANEHMAYLIGWIADCCQQVKTNKFKY